jgi:hypothetical protein
MYPENLFVVIMTRNRLTVITTDGKHQVQQAITSIPCTNWHPFYLLRRCTTDTDEGCLHTRHWFTFPEYFSSSSLSSYEWLAVKCGNISDIPVLLVVYSYSGRRRGAVGIPLGMIWDSMSRNYKVCFRGAAAVSLINLNRFKFTVSVHFIVQYYVYVAADGGLLGVFFCESRREPLRASICPSARLPICPSVHLPVCPSAHLSITS